MALLCCHDLARFNCNVSFYIYMLLITGLIYINCMCITYLDINECAGDHGCHHLCNNTDGSFHCYCNPGYMLHSNGITCTGLP